MLQYIDVNHLETIVDIDLKALYIMDLQKFGVKHIVVKLQTLAAVGIRAEMQFLACCVSLGKYFRATHAHTELRTLHFVQSRDFRRAGSAAAADFSCVRFEPSVAFPWFVTSNFCDSSNLLLF